MAISANVSSTVLIHNNFSFANIKSSTGLTHIMKRNRLSTKNILITLFTFSRSKALIIFNLFQLKYFYVIPTTKIARNISKWWWWYRQRASIYCIATLCVGICQRISLDCPIIITKYGMVISDGFEYQNPIISYCLVNWSPYSASSTHQTTRS